MELSLIAVCLTQRFAEHHRGGKGDVERAKSRPHRNGNACIDAIVHRLGTAGAFAPKHQGVVLAELKVAMAYAGVRRQKDEPSARRLGRVALLHERREARVSRQIDVVEIIERRPFQRSVAHVEACRTDDIDRNVEARAQAKDRPRVLGDIGLVER